MNMGYGGGSFLAPGAFAPTRTLSPKQIRLRVHVALVMLDCCCILAAFLAAGIIYPVSAHLPKLMSFAVIPLYLGIAFRAHAFSGDVIGRPGRAVFRSVQSFLIAASAVLVVAFYLKTSEEISRVISALGFSGSLIALTIARIFFVREAARLLGGAPYSVVVITDDVASEPRRRDLTIVSASAFQPNSDCPRMYDRLGQVLRSADRVVLRCEPELREIWTHALQGANVQAEIVAPEFEAARPLAVGSYEGALTLVVARGPLSTADRVTKRLFDIAVAAAALLFFAPVLLVTAALITLESAGPVFFVQTRIGRGNRQFRMLKFRSMRPESADAAGNASTARDDHRVTRVGRFIRATSIDELPQLFNVLAGDMSIVGPRPHALGSRAGNALFWEIDRRYWHRHAAKPGLTGLAQVRGFRGATERRDDLVNRLRSDLEYLNGWSIWRDLKIMAMTLTVVRHRNAF